MSDEKLDTEVRREQIAQAALELVATQGLRKLSVAAVARRVGLVPSGIYRHYKSKDEIVAAILDLLQRRILDNVETSRRQGLDPLEQLQALLMRHVRAIRENRAIPRIVFSDDVQAGHPQLKSRVEEIFVGYVEAIAGIVREGQQQRLIRKDLTAETAAMMLLGLVIPAGIRWHLTDGGFDVTRHAERAWKVYREMLVGPPQK